MGLPSAAERRYEVFVLSGEAGYQRCVRRVWSVDGESTAGMYSPDLGPLLVWNVSDRKLLFETVRHEGFPQYMDRLVADPPVWLNEGLAVHFENAAFRRGPSREIVLHPEHIATLTAKDAGLLGLDQLVSLRPREFYARPERNCAESWTLVHFLLNSTRDNRALFDSLLEALQAGRDADEATRMAFGEVDLDGMTRALREHVLSL